MISESAVNDAAMALDELLTGVEQVLHRIRVFNQAKKATNSRTCLCRGGCQHNFRGLGVSVAGGDFVSLLRVLIVRLGAFIVRLLAE